MSKEFGHQQSMMGMSPRDARNFLILAEADYYDEKWRGYVAILCWLFPGGMHLQATNYGLSPWWAMEGILWALYATPLFWSFGFVAYFFCQIGYVAYFLLRLSLYKKHLVEARKSGKDEHGRNA